VEAGATKKEQEPVLIRSLPRTDCIVVWFLFDAWLGELAMRLLGRKGGAELQFLGSDSLGGMELCSWSL